jgi:hypothetical protein
MGEPVGRNSLVNGPHTRGIRCLSCRPEFASAILEFLRSGKPK